MVNSTGNYLFQTTVDHFKEKKNSFLFNLREEIAIYPNTLSTLEISFWTKNMIVSDQMIGKLEIDLEQINRQETVSLEESVIAPLSGNDIDESFIANLLIEGKKPV